MPHTHHNTNTMGTSALIVVTIRGTRVLQLQVQYDGGYGKDYPCGVGTNIARLFATSGGATAGEVIAQLVLTLKEMKWGNVYLLPADTPDDATGTFRDRDEGGRWWDGHDYRYDIALDGAAPTILVSKMGNEVAFSDARMFAQLCGVTVKEQPISFPVEAATPEGKRVVLYDASAKRVLVRLVISGGASAKRTMFSPGRLLIDAFNGADDFAAWTISYAHTILASAAGAVHVVAAFDDGAPSTCVFVNVNERESEVFITEDKQPGDVERAHAGLDVDDPLFSTFGLFVQVSKEKYASPEMVWSGDWCGASSTSKRGYDDGEAPSCRSRQRL